MTNDTWKLGNHEFTSRFILGSGKYSLELIKAAVEEAGAQIVTMALRRANEGGLANILDYIPEGVTLLPNTSGARNADEAVRIARLAREVCGSDFIKIEIMRDTKYLLPDNYETIKATEILAKEGFIVMPYMYPDLNMARDMAAAGAACIMPLGAPIGSNKGLCTKEFIQILIDEIDLPIIVDAGIGRPSQACEAMEMGAAAVMANTAIATAGDVKTDGRRHEKGCRSRKSRLSGRYGSGTNKGSQRFLSSHRLSERLTSLHPIREEIRFRFPEPISSGRLPEVMFKSWKEQKMNTETHINESILNDEIREHQKENRIDHMTYLPDMEDIGSEVMDQVISAMNAYDYDIYTENDVRRALAHDNRSLERFQGAAVPRLPCLCWRTSPRPLRRRPGNISAIPSACSPRLIIANYCENYCIYCGFNCHNHIKRAQLNEEEIEKEFAAIAKTGPAGNSHSHRGKPEALHGGIHRPGLRDCPEIFPGGRSGSLPDELRRIRSSASVRSRLRHRLSGNVQL